MQSIKKPPDFILLITVYILLAIGLMIVLSSSHYMAMVNYEDSVYFFRRQLIWAVLGLIGMLVTMNYDYFKLKRLVGPSFIMGFVLLMAVLIPGIGNEVNDARRWIDLGFISFSPAEIFKICIIMFFAYRLSIDGEKIRSFKVLIRYLGIALIAVFLILKQPDMGTAMITCGTVFIMIFIAGSRMTHFIGLGTAGIILALIAIFIKPYRKARLFAFLNPEEDLLGSGYQLLQSLYALGSGGFFGSGLGQGKLKWLYLPEGHTDFIFAILGEELGFIGTTLVILLFVVLLWRGCLIAYQSSDSFACLLTVGIISGIALQAFINIGMVTGCMPITGVPLPLISYGGTSLFITLIGIGIVLNISKFTSAKIEEPQIKKDEKLLC